MSDRPVIIIDGLNLFMRHYAAHPAMSKNGDQVGGIVGFLTGIRRLSEKIGPSEIYVIWEGQGSAKKRHLYKEYKKSKKPKRLNRYYDDIPDSLSNQTSQISVIVKALRFTPVRQLYVEGCEADDAIGYMCRYTLKDRRKVIVSSDHDYYQLLNNNTLIYSPTLKAFVNKKTVKERYRVSAENFCLVKSVAGDQSDNIPGVRGLSYKTIAKMIPDTTSSQELTLDEFFDKAKEIHKIKNTKSTERLVFGETLVRRNWRLVRLDTNNLSLEHINKINTIFENEKGVKDKLGMLRYLMKLGINTLNIDGLYLSLQSLTR
jgi:DNA polymerase-1